MRKIVLAAFTLLALSGAAVAQNFPSRPITIIVPISAGGPSDAMARILAERMKVALGETVLVEKLEQTLRAGSFGFSPREHGVEKRLNDAAQFGPGAAGGAELVQLGAAQAGKGVAILPQ